jgi:TPR repeat protein
MIRVRIHSIMLNAAILSFVVHCLLFAQDQKKPQVFRNTESASVPLVLPSTLDYQLLEAFVLMQKANAGESPAQHELGLRFLLGKGFPADTVKAAFWIQKAANQHLPLAQFNLGILLMNGRGVEWNPFEAFKCFRAAADAEIPEALYVMGLMYTENFIVLRQWGQAYQYFKKAASLGSAGAKITMKEMERRGLDTSSTTDIVASGKERPKNTAARTIPRDTSYNLLFIDFRTDTTSTIEDTTLIREAYQGITALPQTSNDGTPVRGIDSAAQSFLFTAANFGNPEALCLLGRCYERGLNVRKDLILAGVYYLRALHLESYRAPALLWKMIMTEEFPLALEAQSPKNNPDALYVWSGLTSIGFNKLLNEQQAFELLQRAVSTGHVPSIVETGTCYFTGRWIQQDRARAVELWTRAARLGSLEAEIRLAAATVMGQIYGEEISAALTVLNKTAKEGSLFSDVALGYCYEKGVGVQQNKGEAYRIFHQAMLRGSETAFHALRSMHDQLRPSDAEFILREQ